MRIKHKLHFKFKNRKMIPVFFIIPFFLSSFFLFFVLSFTSKISFLKKSLEKQDFENLSLGCTITSFGNGNGTFSASISFSQPNGKMISSYERSWYGKELYAECIVLSFKKNNLVFPYRLYSDKTKKGTGTTLFPYYTIDGFPAVYNYSFFSQKEKKLIEDIFKTSKVLSFISPKFLTAFRNVKMETAVLSDFKADSGYALTFDKKGNLIFKRIL